MLIRKGVCSAILHDHFIISKEIRDWHIERFKQQVKRRTGVDDGTLAEPRSIGRGVLLEGEEALTSSIVIHSYASRLKTHPLLSR